jgi:putative DNA methylase
VHCRFIEAFSKASSSTSEVRDYVAGAYQQYLRNQSLLSFWHLTKDHFAPALSKNNYQPKNTAVEVGVFVSVGYGPWTSTAKPLSESAEWKQEPWELLPKALLPEHLEKLVGSTKSVKVYPGDPVLGGARISCGSSTALNSHADQSVDLVITDPPFGDIMQYGELASFFYPWLRKLLKDCYPEFVTESPPTSLEAVENLHRHGKDQGDFYYKLLTGCWTEAHRILKPGGLLAFTFHHDKDGPWVSVLESLFSAGFYLEAAFPIRSDETKGEGGTPGTFGAQKVEYDVIHVCRKRIDEPQEISWARLRRQILADVHQLEQILQHHQRAGLQEGDLKVIRRGKALEYYSKHYGKVYVERGREFTVKEALTGINQLLDDQRDSTAEVPPVNAEPYTRQFLRLFADTTNLPRDQMQKFLRGTGVSPAEFEERGWCGEKSKIFHFTPPLELAQKWKGVSRQGMGRDFDQAMFLIGACHENSGIRVQDTLNSEKFIPHPATGDVIDWFTRHGGDSQMKDAARLAKQLYTKWVAANQPKVKAAQRTFDFAAEEA